MSVQGGCHVDMCLLGAQLELKDTNGAQESSF
ncbi:hypothetical protein EGR_07968 [Echinococcus granulosus]|uniref:Uncharacterized protein n=1 Tax=Echinococcus granulosus TaxID=6210 RepID=W6U9G0_ECHGR|nr:hypothetical protein EGR_07968 [Echinococcus granulosus]EUB57151.1 hypothetical protein EGR_07968 [Echinococcus granulosus]